MPPQVTTRATMKSGGPCHPCMSVHPTTRKPTGPDSEPQASSRCIRTTQPRKALNLPPIRCSSGHSGTSDGSRPVNRSAAETISFRRLQCNPVEAITPETVRPRRQILNRTSHGYNGGCWGVYRCAPWRRWGNWVVNTALYLNAVSIHRPRKVSRCNWTGKSAPLRLRRHRRVPETKAVSSVGSTVVADVVPSRPGSGRFPMFSPSVGRPTPLTDRLWRVMGCGVWISVAPPVRSSPGEQS